MKIAIGLCFLIVMTNAFVDPKTAPVEFIFIHGDIYPGISGSSPAVQGEGNRVQALAVAAGRIIAAGRSEDILKLKGPKTKVIDLGGRFVMPGFNDAHTHLASAGFEKLNVDLVGAKSLDEMKERIGARVKTAAPGEWITGAGWDHTLWTSQKTPERQEIDAVTGDHPAIFTRVDGHIAIANTAALRSAGINGQTPDPHGGKIDRGENGDATGILRETAMAAVRTKIPPPTPSQRRRALDLALQDAAQWGVTSAQDNSEWEDFLTFEQMEKEGKLTLRISEWLPFDAPLDELKRRRAHHSSTDPMLHTTMLKGFMDGSLGSRTAAMLAPYSDDAKNSGLPRYQQDDLNKKTLERVQAGFQIGFHAIGDRGTKMALDAFAYAKESSKGRPGGVLPFRIEHAQVVSPDDFLRFVDLHVIASMQPNHLLTDMNWAQDRIGDDRAQHSYAWKEFLDYHVPLAFGTDYPVEPVTPFRGIYAAVTRKNEAGSKEYFPKQKLDIYEALEAYTTGSAYAELMNGQKGRLAPDMLADFVVLDRDITKVAPKEILATRVLRTVVGGKTVFEAK